MRASLSVPGANSVPPPRLGTTYLAVPARSRYLAEDECRMSGFYGFERCAGGLYLRSARRRPRGARPLKASREGGRVCLLRGGGKPGGNLGETFETKPSVGKAPGKRS